MDLAERAAQAEEKGVEEQQDARRTRETRGCYS